MSHLKRTVKIKTFIPDKSHYRRLMMCRAKTDIKLRSKKERKNENEKIETQYGSNLLLSILIRIKLTRDLTENLLYF